MSTTNLGITEVSAAQNNKEVTINDGLEQLDQATQGATSHTITGNTDVSASDYTTYFCHVLAGTPGAGFNLNVPATKRFFYVDNGSGQTATVQVTGGAGASVAISDGEGRLLYSDGADIVEAGGGGGGGASAFTGLSDTPSSYSGQGGKVVKVNVGETALIFEDEGATNYDFGFAFKDTPTSSEVLGKVVMARSVLLAANMSGSVGDVGTNPTASWVVSVKDDGVEIGTITVNTSGVFTFATSGGTSKTINAGSVVTFVGPSSADATVAAISVTLAGTLTSAVSTTTTTT